MPKSFNGFDSLSSPTNSTATYTKDMSVFTATYIEGNNALQASIGIMTDTQTIGDWTCGTTSGMTMCVAAAYNGAVLTGMGFNDDAATVAENSKAFLEAWK